MSRRQSFQSVEASSTQKVFKTEQLNKDEPILSLVPQLSPIFSEMIILTLLKMKSTPNGQTKIIVPTLLNGPSKNDPKDEERDSQEEEKIVESPKIFLRPKHKTLPIVIAQRQNYQMPSLRFPPSFDDFNLCHLFQNKILTQRQRAELWGLQDQNYLTPVRQRKQDWPWEIIKSPINFTAESLNVAAESSKKSKLKQKGLKRISFKAYQIVLERKSSTYKEVASRLLDLLKTQKQFQQMQQNEKNEQNIKRRVYDALNVLIASGLLRKQGRKIVTEDHQEQESKEAKAIQIFQQLQNKKKEIKLKKQKIKRLQKEMQVYKELALSHENRTKQSQIIKFPFMVLYNENFTNITPLEVENGECKKLNLRWIKSKIDFNEFEMNVLLKYQQTIKKNRSIGPHIQR